jgi:hypothetical protein
VNRFGLSRPRERITPRRDAAPTLLAAPVEARETPRAGETLYEIGMLIALHLAFAFAVLLTLRAFGVS